MGVGDERDRRRARAARANKRRPHQGPCCSSRAQDFGPGRGRAGQRKRPHRGTDCALALISPASFVVGMVVFGGVPVVNALMEGAAFYLMWLVGPFTGVPGHSRRGQKRFGRAGDQIQALKLTAYAFTPSMLSGVFNIVPAISPLAVVGFYSFYLLWVGLPKVMRPASREGPGLPYAVTPRTARHAADRPGRQRGLRRALWK